MGEAEKAAAILNIRRTITLTDGREFRLRRHKMREVLEHSERLGQTFLGVTSQFPGDTKITQVIPTLLNAIGPPAFAIIAQVVQTEERDVTVEEIGDLDVEDFAAVVDAYTEMHTKAIETFRKAFDRFGSGKSNGRVARAKGLSGNSIGSLEPDIPSRILETSPSTPS